MKSEDIIPVISSLTIIAFFAMVSITISCNKDPAPEPKAMSALDKCEADGVVRWEQCIDSYNRLPNLVTLDAAHSIEACTELLHGERRHCEEAQMGLGAHGDGEGAAPPGEGG